MGDASDDASGSVRRPVRKAQKTARRESVGRQGVPGKPTTGCVLEPTLFDRAFDAGRLLRKERVIGGSCGSDFDRVGQARAQTRRDGIGGFGSFRTHDEVHSDGDASSLLDFATVPLLDRLRSGRDSDGVPRS